MKIIANNNEFSLSIVYKIFIRDNELNLKLDYKNFNESGYDTEEEAYNAILNTEHELNTFEIIQCVVKHKIEDLKNG